MVQNLFSVEKTCLGFDPSISMICTGGKEREDLLHKSSSEGKNARYFTVH